MTLCADKSGDPLHPGPATRERSSAAATYKGLAAGLAASLALHLMAFEFLKSPPAVDVGESHAPLLSVEWRKAAPPASPDTRTDAEQDRKTTIARPAEDSATAAADIATSPLPDPGSVGEAIAERARVAAQDGERRLKSHDRLFDPQSDAVPPPLLPADRPYLAALDRAVKKRAAGERHLPGRILQITTESGSVYCLQEPPDSGSGPLPALSIPMACKDL